MRNRTVLLAILLCLCLLVALFIYAARHKNEEKGFVTLYGNVDVRQVDLGFRVEGRVAMMPFEEGDFVPQGALMAWLDPQPYADEFMRAEASVAASRYSLENAQEVFQRREELIDSGGVSQEDYENAFTSKEVAAQTLKGAIASLGVAKTNLDDTKLYCPSDGTILTRIQEPGAVVLRADPIYTLSLISPIWIRAYLPEPLLAVVKLGMEAEIFTDAKRSKRFRGKVGFISPVAEFTPKTVETTDLRTDLVYRIRIYADNPDWRLKQGMPVTVKLSTRSR